MQTIIIVLNAEKMENPDLDIRYSLPDRIAEYTGNQVTDNGYDFLSGSELGIWLETEDAARGAEQAAALLRSERFSENDLSQIAEIYISEDDSAPIENCRRVYPA